MRRDEVLKTGVYTQVHEDLSTEATKQFASAVGFGKKSNIDKEITILIGPEGGLSPQELKLAEKFNFNPVNLGPRILRTETAAITTVSIIQTLFGDI